MKRSRKIKPYEPSIPRLFSTGFQRSNPSYWQEIREQEAETAAKAASDDLQGPPR
jgi:hypothetical protein